MPYTDIIILATEHGEITIELDHARAPKTAGHFKKLVKDGWLSPSNFYRTVHKAVTPGHLPTIDVLQGGRGFTSGNDAPTVIHEPTTETGLRHVEGTISFARGKDMPASTEFFICLGAFPVLDAGTTDGPGADGFAEFGKVLSGMDVVRRIHGMPANAPAPEGWEMLQGQFISEPVTIHPRAA